MDDPNETRKIASDWREYVADFREMYVVYRWAWLEFVSADAKRWIRKGIGALLFLMVFVLVEPLCLKQMIDALTAGDKASALRWFGTFALSVFLARIANWRYSRSRENLDGTILGGIDDRTTQLFFEKSLGQHLRDDGLLNAPNIEKGRARVFTVENVLVYQAIPIVIELGLSYAFLIVMSPVAGAIMAAVFCVYLVHMLYVNTKVMQVMTPIDAAHRKLYRHRVERWEHVERVLTNGRGKEELSYMRAKFNEIISQDVRFWLWVCDSQLMRGLVNTAGFVLIMLYAGHLVLDGTWSIGFILPLYTWTRRISDNVWRVADIERQLNWNMPSVRAMKTALTQPNEVLERDDAVPLPRDVTPRMEFRNVGHSYGGKAGSLHVLDDATFSVAPGEKVALIGPSGAGKTTIMRLLLRVMDPEQGSIMIGGHDLRDVDLDDWRRLVGYIPQQPQLLDGSLRYNIVYGLTDDERAKVTDEEIWHVMRLLETDFGGRLTEGLDTRVGKRGLKLSGGQAQRVMICAAVMKKPRFLIVDEATSSLDSTTERAVQDGLAKVIAPETSALIIAHRLSTVRHLCGKFVVTRSIEATPAGESQIEGSYASFEDAYRQSPTCRRLANDQGIFLESHGTNGRAYYPDVIGK